jgi:cobalt/nickel transport system ATP-binding protein
MVDGNIVGSGTPQEVFYDDALLTSANLHPPSPVRVARDVGLDESARPVTESELVALLTDGTADSEPIQSIDGRGDD